MALIEQDMVRFADAFDDYERHSVTDMGGWGPDAFWVVVRDHRFGLDYEIASHCDYWDFIGAVVDHRQCTSLSPLKEVACWRVPSSVGPLGLRPRRQKRQCLTWSLMLRSVIPTTAPATAGMATAAMRPRRA